MAETNETDWITLSDFLASHPGLVSEVTLRRYVRAGKIESIQPAGRNGRILIPRNAFDRLLNTLKSDFVEQPNTKGAALTGVKTTTPRWDRPA